AFQGEDAGRRSNVPKTAKPPEVRPAKPDPVVSKREPKQTTRTQQRQQRPSPYASLSITAPQGSSVLINGNVRGSTDGGGQFYLGNLKPGAYTIVVRKAGYRDAQNTISLSGGQASALNFDLTPIPGTLSITTNASGAQIEVQNYGSYTDRISSMELPPGTYQISISKPGYRTLAREVQVKSGEDSYVPITLEPVPVEEILAKAGSHLVNRNYPQVQAICRGILATNPEQPGANLLMGLSYYYTEQYSAGAPYLLKAIALGEQVVLPIRHHHRVFLSDDLCTGRITIGKGLLSFTSMDRSGHDFVVPAASVYDLKFEPRKGGRVHMQVGIQKGAKEDKKSYNFHVIHAGTRLYEPNNPSSITVVYCNNCDQETELLYQLLQLLQQSAPRPANDNKQKKRNM
ncbi:MAG: PEGA domain-containing protein, partial [Acidobacteria bacterium]|nr:PEGA domain-containing protein [Acidobacteriota bacterium]